MDDFVRKLLQEEEAAITRVVAFMSYNPAIGRVLEKGGVRKFQGLAVKLVGELPNVRDQRAFDHLHERYTRRVIRNFETSRGESISYGQAQKPINVFLKVYVDWAARPDRVVSRRVLPFLHVPLDSVLMDAIAKKYKGWYQAAIKPHVKGAASPHALSALNKWQYDKWQTFFRNQYPTKPLIYDVVWALER